MALVDAVLTRLGCFLDDLVQCSEPEVRARDLSSLGRLALVCMQFVRGRTDDAARSTIRRNLDLITAAMDEPGGQDGLQAVCWYILQVTTVPFQDLAAVLGEANDPRLKETFMSTAEKMQREARREGHVEGRVEGRVEGMVEVLVRQLTSRFGPLPSEMLKRIRAATVTELDRWVDRFVFAKTLDEVFA